MANPNKTRTQTTIGASTMADAMKAAEVTTAPAPVADPAPAAAPVAETPAPAERDIDAEVTAGVMRPTPTRHAPFDLLTFVPLDQTPYVAKDRTSVGIVDVVARVAASTVNVVFRVGLAWPNATPNEQSTYVQIPGYGRLSYKTDGVTSTDPVADSALSLYLDQVAEYAADYFERRQIRLMEEAAKAAAAAGEQEASQMTVARKVRSLTFATKRK